MDSEETYFYSIINEVSNLIYPTRRGITHKQIQDGCNSARSEAIKRIKDNTVKYLKAGPAPITVDKDQIQHKALRGLNDATSGAYLSLPKASINGTKILTRTSIVHL
jgi:hypothetical protein